MILFWEIIKEKPGFQCTQLTKVGHLDETIKTIFAFKKEDDRYLRIEVDSKISKETLSLLEKKLKGLASLKALKTDDEKLEELFKSTEVKTATSKRALYFDRATYV